MIRFIYGASGSGKTHAIFEQLSHDPSSAILLVPEQQTVLAERESLDRLPPAAQLEFEVLNFTRLCNRVFRLYGGLSYHYITPAMKSLFMWRTLRELSPLLEEYGAAGSELSLTDVMLSGVEELSASGVTSDALEAAANKLGNGGLRAKLRDLSLISAAYKNLVSQSFDDKENDLAKLCDILKKHKFFKGKRVFIDSFTSFTAPEYAVLEQIFSQADEVTVALGCDSPSSTLICFESICDTAKRLASLAERLGRPTDRVYLTGNFRAQNAEIASLSVDVWRARGEACVPENERGNVRLIECRDPYDEADAVVAIIKRELMRGLRCREIAVVARDSSRYNGILDAALEAAEIPYFMSQPTDLSVSPVMTLILSALRIKYLGFRAEDVLTHLKTGIYPLPIRDIDMFEEYVTTWGISGRRFTEAAWSMNPDGYTDRRSPRADAILTAANRVRELLLTSLDTLFARLDAAECVRDMCAALWGYVEQSRLSERLSELAERAISRGDRRAAADALAVYDVIVAMLDDLAGALGDEKLTVEELYRACLICVSSASSGAIPTGYDEVTVGSASLLRVSGIRCAVLVGLNEGEFPAKVSESGIFSDADRASLAELGLELGRGNVGRAAEELLFVNRAMSLPSERLYCLYCSNGADGGRLRPSMAVSRLRSFLDYLPSERFAEEDPTDAIYTRSVAAERLSTLPDSARLAVLTELGERAVPVVSEPSCSVSAETMSELLGERMSMTQSKLERYVSCNFAYFCEELLGLRPESRAEVDYSVSGSFIHTVLENFMRRAVTEDGLADIDVGAAVDTVINELIAGISTEEQRKSNRLKHLFLRLRRLSLLMISSLKHEFELCRFRPEFFELKIGRGGVDPLTIRLSDGSSVSLRGVVDRVDVWRQDGEVYLRVVDYKTGAKKFSLDDIKSGLNLQLLVYLFSLCRVGKFAEECGCEAGKAPIPASASYLSAHVSAKSYAGLPGAERALSDAEASIDRSGVYLAEKDVLDALGVDPKSGLLDREGIDSLRAELESTVADIAQALRSGRADAEPHIGSSSPCDYCKFASVCRAPKKSRY